MRGPDEIYSRFDWTVAEGESWVVLGPSGCGKTTLVYLLAGLRRPLTGLRAAGWTGGDRAPHLHRTDPAGSRPASLGEGQRQRRARAEDPARLLRCRARLKRVARWLERLGIDAVAGKYPGQLSGGQRQRVAIARTLALNPSLLLMDEPFSSLDSTTARTSRSLVVALSEESRTTTVLVTHDIQEAVFLGRRS